MGLIDGLGTIFAPGAAANVHAKANALNAYLAPGSDFYNAGNLGLSTSGSEGNALVNAATRIGANDVSANFAPLQQDQAALSNLGESYYQQFLHGGKAEAAARNRAVASSADAGGGGIAGIKNLETASQQLSGQASQTSLQERQNSGDQANSNFLQAGMLEIRQRALKAAVTHANIQKGIAAQAALNNLQNQQTQNNLQLQSAAIGGQHALNSGQLNLEAANNQTGLGVLGALTSAAGAATAIGVNAVGKNVDAPQLTESEIQNAANNKLAQYGVDVSKLPSAAPALTGQEAAQINQDALMKALGTGSSKISYPTLQSTAVSVLSDPSSYPLTTSMRS